MFVPHKMSKDGHDAVATFNGCEVRVICSCNGEWTHPTHTSISIIDDIFNSHVAYFTREPMKTL